MASNRNHRKVSRTTIDFPQIAVISFETNGTRQSHFVKVVNLSIQGALIQSQIPLDENREVHFTIKNVELDHWDSFYCRIAWSQRADIEHANHLGLEYLFPLENNHNEPEDRQIQIIHNDIEFLLNLNLLKTIPHNGINPFLNALTKCQVKKATDLFSLDTSKNSLFIIQKGFCAIRTNNNNTPIAFRGAGEIIGDVAFLGNGMHQAKVTAESDMITWQLTKDKFQAICRTHPKISAFLTRLFISQLDNPDNRQLRAIGDYHISSARGEDAFSLFFHAQHKFFQSTVCVKMLKHIHAADTGIINEMIRRSKIIRKISHPNIAQLIEINKYYGTLFTTSEKYTSQTIGKILERAGRVPFFNCLKILYQIASGLACAHERKLYYHVIHPDHFIVTDDCRVKLINLEVPYKDIHIDDNTHDFFHYLPPEKFKTSRLAHFDIYGFGRLAYEMITGNRDNTTASNTRQMKNGFNSAFDLDAVPDPELVSQIKQIIFRACSESQKDRYGSMRAIEKDLGQILSAHLPGFRITAEEKQETTVLFISHTSSQRRDLYDLLDSFHEQAAQKGLSLSLAKIKN